jgi:hypothetical protein
LTGINSPAYCQAKTESINYIDILNLRDLLKQNFQFTLTENFTYALSFNNFLKWERKNKASSLIALSQDVFYKLTREKKHNLTFCFSFRHQLGFQYIPDSIINKTIDETILSTKSSLAFIKNIHFSLTTDATMPLLNSYYLSYNDSTGLKEKILNEGFLTPFECTLSGGLVFVWEKLGTITIGLSSARLVYVHNKAVFNDMNNNIFHGVGKNKKYHIEYGLSTELTLFKEFGNFIKWNCDIKAFKNFNMPVDLNIRNEISFILGKHVKSSIQTKFNYEQQVSKSPLFENIVTIGLYFGTN